MERWLVAALAAVVSFVILGAYLNIRRIRLASEEIAAKLSPEFAEKHKDVMKVKVQLALLGILIVILITTMASFTPR